MISEDTDLLEPTLLDELICHIGTLASVYHKPPNTFVEGRFVMKKHLPLRSGSQIDYEANNRPMSTPTNQQQQQVVISSNVGSLLDDFDILGPMPTAASTAGDLYGHTQQPTPSSVPNLIDEELSSILGFDSNVGGHQTPTMNTTTSIPTNRTTTSSANDLDDLFGDLNLQTGGSGLLFTGNTTFALPKEVKIQ